MRIVVAGEDRSEALGARIARALSSRSDGGLPRTAAENVDALSLPEAGSEQEFETRHLAALRMRTQLRTADFAIPERPGLRGRLQRSLKRFLWRLLRYQHDRMAWQQNQVNAQFMTAIELLRDLHGRELDGLRESVDELERRLAACREDG